MMMRNLLAGLALVVLALSTGVPGADAASITRRSIEGSMTLTGSVDIEPDGAVSSYVLDQADKLASDLAGFMDATITGWHFEPVRDAEGQAIPVRAPFRLRLVAEREAGDKFSVALRSVDFSEKAAENDATRVRVAEQAPPKYPSRALKMRQPAHVLLAIQVGRDGRVHNVSTRRVNLFVPESTGTMAKLRKEFAEISERAAWGWTYRVPTEGPEANAESWTFLVPVHYRISGDPRGDDEHGKWMAYIPGELRPIRWLEADEAARMPSSDALVDNGIYQPREDGLRLLNPPGEG